LNKELIIHSTPTGVDVALLEDKKLIELHQERHTNHFLVGDIYLARIKKVMPGLNAAFIDIGYEKDAFLHYTDLSPEFRTLLKFTGQAVLVIPMAHLIHLKFYRKSTKEVTLKMY
jgi:ribonuclease G